MTDAQWLAISPIPAIALQLRRKVMYAIDARGMRWAWMAGDNPLDTDWIEYVPEAKDQCH